MTIDANELRKLAETADGLRNQNLALVKRGNEHLVIPAGEMIGGDEQLIALRTDDPVTPAQRPPFEIALTISGGPSIELGSAYDSLFWTLSAVDKFVLPYYARLWPPAKVLAFRDKLSADATWVAVDHPPGSTADLLLYQSGQLRHLPVEEYLDDEEEERQQATTA